MERPKKFVDFWGPIVDLHLESAVRLQLQEFRYTCWFKLGLRYTRIKKYVCRRRALYDCSSSSSHRRQCLTRALEWRQELLHDAGLDDADSSQLSLNEEEDVLSPSSSIGVATEEEDELAFVSVMEYEDLKSTVSLEVPAIDKSLKNDKQLNDYLANLHRLVANKVRQLETEIQDEEGKETKKARLSHYPIETEVFVQCVGALHNIIAF